MIVKIVLLSCFVLFIPVSAACYFYSRRDQRESEVKRYMAILNIEDEELFKQRNQGITLLIAVLFISFLSVFFWALILFGDDMAITDKYNYLFGNVKIILMDEASEADVAGIKLYQRGAVLTFSMAFLGAYLWGIQSIARRYAMNDLIPIAYYNLGVRMIFSGILALVFYHLYTIAPDLVSPTETVATDLIATEGVEVEGSAEGAEVAGSTEGAGATEATGGADKAEATSSTSADLTMPIIAFLIGMFPQKGLKWLTNKFSIFSQKNNSSVRDLPLEMIEGVDVYDSVRLQELGIDSCYDLANIDYVPYLFKTPYSPRVLINWILQAKLCVYFGEHVKELREHGIHTIWQIYNYNEDELKAIIKSVSVSEDTMMLVKGLVAKEHEIERLVAAQTKLSQYWDVAEEDIDNIIEHEAR